MYLLFPLFFVPFWSSVLPSGNIFFFTQKEMSFSISSSAFPQGMKYFRVCLFVWCLKIFYFVFIWRTFASYRILLWYFVFFQCFKLIIPFIVLWVFTVSVEKVNHQFYFCFIEGHVHFFFWMPLRFSLCHWSSLLYLDMSRCIFLFIYLPWGSLRLWINELTSFINIIKFVAIVSSNFASALVSFLAWLQLYTY